MKFNKLLFNSGEFTSAVSMLQPVQNSMQIVQLENSDIKVKSTKSNEIDQLSNLVKKISYNVNEYQKSDISNFENKIVLDIEKEVYENIFTKFDDQQNFRSNFSELFNSDPTKLIDKQLEILNKLFLISNVSSEKSRIQAEILNLNKIKNVKVSKEISDFDYKNKDITFNNLLRFPIFDDMESWSSNQSSNYGNQSSNYGNQSNDQNNQLKNINDQQKFKLQKKEWNNFYNNLKKTEKDLSKYLRDIKIFNGISAALAAAAWAITATYTAAAFFTFGATVPSAVASGVQAGIMTYFVNEAFNTQYEIEDKLKTVKLIKDSKEINFMNRIVKLDYKSFENELKKTRNSFGSFGISDLFTVINVATTFSATRLAVSMGLEVLTAKIINKVASKTTIKLGQNFALIKSVSGFTKLFKTSVLRSTITTISKFAGNITSKRIALIATSFASPISTIISTLDTIVSVGSIIHTLTWQ